MTVELRASRVVWPLKKPFRIAYEEIREVETVLVELRDGSLIGRGEAAGVSYHGETAQTMLQEIEGVRAAVEGGASRAALKNLLPPGGVRNAIDCAVWDLEAKRSGRRAWTLAHQPEPSLVTTFFTLGIDDPSAMAAAAEDAARRGFDAIKLKLSGEGDIERVASVRRAAPGARLIVDANQSWRSQDLATNVDRLAALGVELIEQPLPSNVDEALEGFVGPIPICADESCQTSASLDALRGKYQVVNIKLDKTGGLTEAFALADAARRDGFRLMVGNMCGSSLAMAPAFLIAQQCDFVDLDGPLLNATDVAPPLEISGNVIAPPSPSLWG